MTINNNYITKVLLPDITTTYSNVFPDVSYSSYQFQRKYCLPTKTPCIKLAVILSHNYNLLAIMYIRYSRYVDLSLCM